MEAIEILIVEDEMIIAAHIEETLINAGFKVAEIINKGELVPGFLSDNHADIVLMDINLAGQLDGIETAKIVKKLHKLPIIFLTSNIDESSFDRAKEALPHAYLTKPFKEADLLRSIEVVSNRMLSHKQTNSVAKEVGNIIGMYEYIFVKDGDRMVKIKIKDILYVEADRNYCKIKTRQEDFLISVPLKSVEVKVLSDTFVRIHRSFLANLQEIDGFDQNYLFNDDQHIPISKNYKSEVMSRLNVV